MALNFEKIKDVENSQQLLDFINDLHDTLLKMKPCERLEYLSKVISLCKNIRQLEYILQECQKNTIAELTSEPQLHKTEVKPRKYNGKYAGVEWVMEEFGVSRQTVYSWVTKRLIPHKKIGKHLLFEKQEVYEHAQTLRVKTVKELKQKAIDDITKRRKKQ